MKTVKFRKYIDFSAINNYMNENINEIAIMAKLKKFNSPNILTLHDFYLNSEQEKDKKFEFILILELCDLTLANFLEYFEDFNHKMDLNEEELLLIFYDLLKAYMMLIENKICHRDLKPQNILFKYQDFSFKLADFGEGKFLDLKTFNNNNDEYHSPRGTPSYMSPEIYEFYKTKKKIIYNPISSDFFSLGITFLLLINGNKKK